MLNPLDGLNLSRSQKKDLDELEKLAGFSPSSTKGKNMLTQLAGDLVKKKETKSETKVDEEENRFWNIHKRFAEAYDANGRAFALFIGDLLDIMLSGPVQARLVSEMIEEKLAKIRKAREAEALEEAAKKRKKYNVGGKISSKYDVEIGGEKRVFSRHFLKRKSFLAALFLDSDEFQAFKKLVKQIDIICKNEDYAVPEDEEGRKEALDKILGELRYEIKPTDVIRFWKLLDADNFKYLDEIFNKTRNLNLVRPTFYEDVDKAYRDGKKLLKLLIKDVQTEFPPNEDKQEAYEDYLKDILEVYTHHHFVLKHFNQTRPSISLKDFELTKEELQEKIGEMRSEADKLKEQINKLIIERDEAKAETRAVKIENEEVKAKLSKLDPAEVRKQLSAAEAKVNAANKELKETLEEDALLRTEFRKLDNENQELTSKLRQLNALPDENANSVEGLMKGKRIVIFGGGSREQYWPTLKEAGVEESDYEWYEGFHTISQARTNEIVGRCDVAVVMTSYAGHLYLFQVRACINKNQHLFLIHNSGAGTLRTEILKTFGKK